MKRVHRIQIIWLLFISIYLPTIVQAQQVLSRTNTKQIRIGEIIEYTIQATYNPDLFRIQFPTISDTFNHFELVQAPAIDTITHRGSIEIKHTYKISNYDSGMWTIPAAAVHLHATNGRADTTLYTEAIPIQVQTLAIDTSKGFMPIADIRDAPMPWQTLCWYALLILLIILLVGFIIFYLIKKWKAANKPHEIIAVASKLPPHEEALQSLQRTEEKAIWKEGLVKDYYTEIADIMRTYIARQFEMDVFDKSTSEIMQQVRKVKYLSTVRQQLRQLLELADLVKFAKTTPTASEHMASIETAREIILASFKKFENAHPSSPTNS